PDHNFSATLDHTQDRRFFLLERAAPRRTFEPSAASRSALLEHRFRMSFVPSYHVHLVTFHFTAQLDALFLTTIPARSWVVMSCTTSLSRSSSAAICWLDRFKPMKYKHSTPLPTGDGGLQTPFPSSRPICFPQPCIHT